jgi:DtxR family Mn-dependent transcriptional regulator
MWNWLENIMLAVAGLAILLWVAWPRNGLAVRYWEHRRLRARVRREDALKHILKGEANRQPATLDSVAGVLRLKPNAAARLLAEMEQLGLLSHEDGELRLRPAGRELAVHIVRAHRLWESFLAEQTGVADREWHHRAEFQEHFLSVQEADALSARLGYPMRDPHGDAIPEEHGELGAEDGRPLNAAEPGQTLLLTHIEDEPETIYEELSSLGLRPGQQVVITEKTPARIRFRADGQPHTLAPIQANNLFVTPWPAQEGAAGVPGENLADLLPGQRARVLGLAPACRGPERRRLLDLGFVPGTGIEVEMVSPAGDPTAYRLRGSVIALRREQARLVRIGLENAQAA